MAEVSVRSNRFIVGSQHLDTQEIFSPHKKSIDDCLAKIFQQHVESPPSKEIPFQVQFKAGQPTLSLENREINLENSRELKRVGRVVRYYQHTDQLPRDELNPKDLAIRNAETRKSVIAINNASLPGSNGNLLAGMRLADDTLSLTRNILFAIPSIGPSDPVVNHLGYYAGMFWTFFSFRELDDGITEYKRSKTIGDAEGQRRSEARILSGGLVSAGSLAYLGGKFCDTFASSAAASSALTASNVLFGVGSLLAIGSSVLGTIRCSRFNSRLNEYLENPDLSESQKMKGALKFLKDSITVTPEERADLVFEIDQNHPDWSSEKKEQLLQQKIADLTEVKVKYMKRRTSNKSLQLILNKSDDLIAKLNDPETCAEGIKESIVLINTIRQENQIKLSLYVLGLIASILSFVGMMVAAFTTAGVVPFVLYGISGTIYLAMTIYTVAGNLIPKGQPNKEIEMPSEGIEIDVEPTHNLAIA